MKSHASASSQPPPSAKPLTAAMTGKCAASIASPERVPQSANALACATVIVAHRRDVGAGGERLFARAGEDRAAHARVARRARRRRARAPSASSTLSALSLSGRFRVRVDDGAVAVDEDGGEAVMLVLARSDRAPGALALVVVDVEALAALLARASRRRRGSAAASARGTCRRPMSRWSTSAMASTVSRPMRSASSSGPIGWLSPSFAPVSMSSGVPRPFLQREAGLAEHRDEHAVTRNPARPCSSSWS